MRKKRWLICGLMLLLMIVLVLIGLDQRLLIRRYEVETEQLDQPVRLAVLTDYHGCDYGENGAELTAEVAALQPDLIMLVGDMFSADSDNGPELTFFRSLTEIADCYYVTGNHEYWEQKVPALLESISQTGVHVLQASGVTVEIRGERLNLCGIPDPYGGGNTEDYLTCAAADIDPAAYTILLAHRPELFEKYAAAGCFDLALCGHAHGGQVRIPLLVNGLYGPHEGWFPKYAGGRYELDGTTMIVSRGLSDQRQMGVPRIFNRPELLLVELK